MTRMIKKLWGPLSALALAAGCGVSTPTGPDVSFPELSQSGTGSVSASGRSAPTQTCSLDAILVEQTASGSGWANVKATYLDAKAAPLSTRCGYPQWSVSPNGATITQKPYRPYEIALEGKSGFYTVTATDASGVSGVAKVFIF